MADSFPPTATMQSAPALYHGGADTILNVLRAQNAATIMIIAHNPGIGEFASRILETPVNHPRFQDYPTGATTIIDFETNSWSEIAWGRGHAEDFVVPRELLAG